MSSTTIHLKWDLMTGCITESDQISMRYTSWWSLSGCLTQIGKVDKTSILAAFITANGSKSWHFCFSCGSASDWADDDCVIVVNMCINYKSVSEQTVYCVYCTECMEKRSLRQEWNGRSDMQYVLSTYCGVTITELIRLGNRHSFFNISSRRY